MKRTAIFIFSFFIQFTLCNSQSTIKGYVIDTNNNPLPGASVCVENSNICTTSDMLGEFTLDINKKKDFVLVCRYIGYVEKRLEIGSIDTMKNEISLKMELDTVFISRPISYKKYWGFTASFLTDFIWNDFNQFQNYLGDYNIDLMNRSGAITSWELAPTYNRFFASFIFGINFSYDTNHDSLKIDFNTTSYGLNIGYKIVDSKRVILMPRLSAKWYRYRLLNYDRDNKITVNNYLTNRDLDLRFNQTIGFAGLDLAFKIYKDNILLTDYWTVGVYAGYITKFNRQPWIYTHKNRIIDESSMIEMGNYNIGIFISFNTD